VDGAAQPLMSAAEPDAKRGRPKGSSAGSSTDPGSSAEPRIPGGGRASEVEDAWLLRLGAASIWLCTGLLVLHPEYRRIGAGELAKLGLPSLLMGLTCAAEVVLGLLALRRPRAPWQSTAVAGVQWALVCGFTTILAAREPLLLAHPYGILSKNLPLLAVVACSWQLEREGRWTERALWTLRIGVAVIWITEGLLPKILFQQPLELDVVRGSGLVPIDASLFLTGMGLAQIASGVLALVLRGRPLLVLLACHMAALTFLPLLVSWQDPLLWVHPFGPMTKNIPIVLGTLVAWRRVRAGLAVTPAPVATPAAASA
jgi:hypothetical protein